MDGPHIRQTPAAVGDLGDSDGSSTDDEPSLSSSRVVLDRRGFKRKSEELEDCDDETIRKEEEEMEVEQVPYTGRKTRNSSRLQGNITIST